MIKACLHPNENERLIALRKLEILDTEAEKEFDDISQIAKNFFKVDMVFISFVDEYRQWFKSKIGIDVQGTDRDSSFCGHTILKNDFLIIPDALKDERFFDNPNVTSGLKIRFYAGYPICDPETLLPIATLCLVDPKPNNLDHIGRQTLQALALQVQKLIELKQKVKSIVEMMKKTVFQRVAFETMFEGIVIHDQQGQIIDFNKSALKVLEVTEDQLKGSTVSRWVTVKENGEPYPVDEHPASKSLSSGESYLNCIMGLKFESNPNLNFEAQNTKWISINASPVFLESKTSPSHVVATFRDITENRLNQQKLIRSEKMNALGELTSEIAHEINTPLAIINLATYQMINSLNKEKPNKKLITQKLKLVESTVQRISLIIEGLKNFVRSSEKSPMIEDVLLQKIIEDCLILAEDKFKKAKIKLSYSGKKKYFIKCVPSLLSQVLINLLNNSYDAVSKLPKPWVKITVVESEASIKISVIDSGRGIAKEIVTKIMEPFFTTKPEGQGTGLGLSISQDVIESMNGKLYYQLIGKNTAFTIELPFQNSKLSQSPDEYYL